MKRSTRLILAGLLITISIYFSACAQKTKPLESHTFFALGTTCTVSIYGGTEKQFAEIEALVNDIEDRMSVNIETSEISLVNESAGVRPAQVSEDVFDVISRGIRFSELSNGTFDISVGPLVSLWDIGGGGNSVPPEEQIRTALALTDYREVELKKNSKGGTIFLPRAGMALDPGGIAKGYAADAIAAYIRNTGTDSALINLGGNILGMGKKEDGSNWRIGIQDPDSSRGDYIGIIPVSGKAVVTSGKYERFFIADGIRYHHILSTTSGYPAENGIAQVSIISTESTTADAMSTAVFSMGLEKGLELANKVEDVEAVIVMENSDVFLSGGLKDSFKITNSAFKLQN